MCRELGHPNYYRCEWKKSATAHPWVKGIIEVGTDTAADILADRIDPAGLDRWNALRANIFNAVSDELSNMPTGDLASIALALGRPQAHVICGLLAEIGAACAETGSLKTNVAATIGRHVEEKIYAKLTYKKKRRPFAHAAAKTAATLVGHSVRALTAKLWTFVDPTADVSSQLGFLADSAAVDLCPAQPTQPLKHPEVELAARRIDKTVSKALITAMLDRNIPVTS